nr:hypothetical protein [Candidatus Bathyarchaeota archaeon]
MKSYLAFFTILSLVFMAVYAAYTIPAQASLGGVPYFVNTRVWASLFAYGAMTVAAATLTLLAYRASRPLIGVGRRVMDYFTLAFAFYTLSVTTMTTGLSFFVVFGVSFNPTTRYGFIYPCCLPVAMMFSGIAPYFMLKFSHLMSEQEEPSAKREASVLVPLAALLTLLASPQNWFGCYAPRLSLLDMQLKPYLLGTLDPFFNLGVGIYPDLRPLSNGLLLVVNFIAIVQILVFLRYRIRREAEPLKAARLKTVSYGFMMALGFFVCYTLDAVIGGPYSVLMFIGFGFILLALILMYLGTVTPKWYISRLQKMI